jgi:hypothetical protein
MTSNFTSSDVIPLTRNLLSINVNHALGVSGQKSGRRKLALAAYCAAAAAAVPPSAAFSFSAIKN